jgi:hypothetical protein
VARVVTPSLLVAVACGSSDADPASPICEVDEPIQLLGVVLDDDISVIEFTRAADYVLAGIGRYNEEPMPETTHATYAIDVCGESAVELDGETTEAAGSIGAAGPWMFETRRDIGETRWIDPEGHAPSHVVFESAYTCAVQVAGGLAMIDDDGTLWFHSNPADPDVRAIAVAHDLTLPHHTQNLEGDFSCKGVDGHLPFVEGDALLVAERDGPLVRVSIPGEERETIIDAAVAEFAVLDNPRYILWLEGIDGTADCCNLQVRDRDDGGDLLVSRERSVRAASWDGRWVSTHVPPESPDVVSTQFLDVETGVTLSVDGEWSLEAQLLRSRLLVHREPAYGDDGARILDVTTGTLEPIDLPPPGLNTPTYPDGVVRFDGPGEGGTLLLLPFDDSGIEVLAAEVQTPWARLQDGTIVFVERVHDDDVTGTLVFLRDGQKHVIDTGVRMFTIPFYGTDRELAEVLYDVHDPARAGLWRFVLP